LLPHSFTNYVSNNDATCTKDGTKTAKCDNCDATETVTDEDTATGHTAVTDPAVKSTCTEPGLTEGSHCSVCGEFLTAQEEVPATGHSFTPWTSDGQGSHDRHCLNCGFDGSVACALTEVPQADPQADPDRVCPICGYRETDENLLPLEGVKAVEGMPHGELAVFITTPEEEDRLLSIAFQSGGALVQPDGKVRVRLSVTLLELFGLSLADAGDGPALPESFGLALICPDAAEIPVECAIVEGEIEFVLDFAPDDTKYPALFLRILLNP
jgi:hypothetical protein